MKGLVPFLVVIAVLGGGGYFLMDKLAKDLDEAQFMDELNAQRVAFAEQAPFTRAVPDDKVKFERGQLVSWHKSAVEAIFKKHPDQQIEDRYIKEMEEKQSEKKNKNEAKLAQFKERYDWLKGVWDSTLSRGDYDTVLTQEKNGVRFDVVDMKPWTPPEGGKPSLRMDLLIWGGLRDQLTFGSITIQFVREIEETDKRGRTTTKKAIAKIEGGGPPTVLHPSGPNPAPMKWIPEWPPGVSAGYYVGLPLFAPDATKASISFDLSVRTQGGTVIPVELKWENVEVRPEWKAPAGSTWDADVAEATDEELAAAGIK